MKVCLIGCSSEVIKSLKNELMLENNEFEFISVSRSVESDHHFDIHLNAKDIDASLVPTDCDFYVISLGLLYSKRISEQTQSERVLSVNVNLLAPVLISEMLLEKSERARIVILGSESGLKGSYDTTYFLTKAALSAYVRERQISYPSQTLNMISPSLIIDSKMTQSRSDLPNVFERLKSHPKKRGAYSGEVAKIIAFLIKGGDSYLSNEEIAINGGKFARMNYH